MKCLVLAAGYATRLYPLTEDFPKPLLKVGGKAILDWLADDIESSCRADACAVVSNHRFAPFFEQWAAARKGFSVVDDGTSTNETRLGAVNDIHYAIEASGWDDDVLIVAGDNVLDFSLVKFIDYARDRGTSCIMRYYEPDEARLHKSGIVTVGQDDLVLGMEEKPAEPKSNWCCPPFYFCTRDDVARIPEGIAAGCGTDAPGSYIAWLSGQTPVHAMEMPGHRFDIGDLESYRNVCDSYRGILAAGQIAKT